MQRQEIIIEFPFLERPPLEGIDRSLGISQVKKAIPQHGVVHCGMLFLWGCFLQNCDRIMRLSVLAQLFRI